MSTTETPTPLRPRYWYVLFVFACGVSLVSMRYLSGNPDVYFPDQRETFMEHQGILIAHIVGALVALVLGAVQMLPSVRAHRPRVHRLLGRLYSVGVLIGAVFGLLLARTAFGGSVSTWGFSGLALAWIATLVPAIGTIRAGNVAAHRRWMIRNYAVTYAAVTLRLWLPLLDAIPGVDFINAYRAVAWLSWVPNLIVIELFLRRHRTPSVADEQAQAQLLPSA